MARKRKRPLILIRDLVPGTKVDSHFLLRGFSPGSGNGPKLRARVWDRTGGGADRLGLGRGVAGRRSHRVVGALGSTRGACSCAERVEPCPRRRPPGSAPIGIASGGRDVGVGAPMRRVWQRPSARAPEPLPGRRRAVRPLETGTAAVRHHHAYAGGLLEHARRGRDCPHTRSASRTSIATCF